MNPNKDTREILFEKTNINIMAKNIINSLFDYDEVIRYKKATIFKYGGKIMFIYYQNINCMEISISNRELLISEFKVFSNKSLLPTNFNSIREMLCYFMAKKINKNVFRISFCEILYINKKQR